MNITQRPVEVQIPQDSIAVQTMSEKPILKRAKSRMGKSPTQSALKFQKAIYQHRDRRSSPGKSPALANEVKFSLHRFAGLQPTEAAQAESRVLPRQMDYLGGFRAPGALSLQLPTAPNHPGIGGFTGCPIRF
jgi:hypothetical protein